MNCATDGLQLVIVSLQSLALWLLFMTKQPTMMVKVSHKLLAVQNIFSSENDSVVQNPMIDVQWCFFIRVMPKAQSSHLNDLQPFLKKICYHWAASRFQSCRLMPISWLWDWTGPSGRFQSANLKPRPISSLGRRNVSAFTGVFV